MSAHTIGLCTLGLSILPPGVDGMWRFVLVGTLSAAIFGAAKAGFGGGIGVISTPLMVYACEGDSGLAIALMLPLLIVGDWVSMRLWWGKWDWRNVRLLVPGSLVGVGIGAALLALFMTLGGYHGAQHDRTNAAITLVIGLIAVIFVGLRILSALRGRLAAFRPVGWQGAAMGAAAGITSTLSHSAGPVVGMFLIPQQMPKGRFVATTVIFFWILNHVKLIPYIGLGLLDQPTIAAELMLLPGVVAGALLGVALHTRVNEAWFGRVVYALLGVMGVHLTVTSILDLV